jgi:uncharacterized protein
MDLISPSTAPLRTSVAAGGTPRLPGPDVVRAVALIGVVVMNYHGYLIIEAGGDRGEGWAAAFFDPWTGPLSTRFAATFVLVAGVGITLLTRRCVATGVGIGEMRWRLVRRGVVLYVGGLFLDEVWPGTIIPYYGAMFAIAALLFTLRSRWIVVVGTAAALAGWGLRSWRWWRAEDGASTSWLTDPDEGSLRGYVYDVAVNGTHPLLPWLAFLCAGMLLGRALRTPWWRPAALGTGAACVAAAAIVSSWASTPFEVVMLSTHPGERGLVYVCSALGTALLAYAAIDWLAERFTRPLDPLRRAGQMTLTIYLLHVLVYDVVVEGLGLIDPAGLDVALVFSVGFWLVAIVLADWWSKRFGRGPAERVYRALGG